MRERKFITIREYRPCIAAGQKYLFHMWMVESQVIPPSNIRGGHSGGQISNTWALVEDDSGNMWMVRPSDIRFLDHPFQDYDWSEDK